MQKIVINNCYGGFGLSPEATLELWNRGGAVEATPIDDYFDGDDGPIGKTHCLNQWRKYLAGDQDRAPLILHVFSPDETLALNPKESERDDPELVRLVEGWGEKANGKFAELKVVEIPDGVEWEIEEYDGIEWVAEKHRRWS